MNPSEQVLDFRSDTFTKPGDGMRQARWLRKMLGGGMRRIRKLA